MQANVTNTRRGPWSHHSRGGWDLALEGAGLRSCSHHKGGACACSAGAAHAPPLVGTAQSTWGDEAQTNRKMPATGNIHLETLDYSVWLLTAMK